MLKKSVVGLLSLALLTQPIYLGNLSNSYAFDLFFKKKSEELQKKEEERQSFMKQKEEIQNVKVADQPGFGIFMVRIEEALDLVEMYSQVYLADKTGDRITVKVNKEELEAVKQNDGSYVIEKKYEDGKIVEIFRLYPPAPDKGYIKYAVKHIPSGNEIVVIYSFPLLMQCVAQFSNAYSTLEKYFGKAEPNVALAYSVLLSNLEPKLAQDLTSLLSTSRTFDYVALDRKLREEFEEAGLSNVYEYFKLIHVSPLEYSTYGEAIVDEFTISYVNLRLLESKTVLASQFSKKACTHAVLAVVNNDALDRLAAEISFASRKKGWREALMTFGMIKEDAAIKCAPVTDKALSRIERDYLTKTAIATLLSTAAISRRSLLEKYSDGSFRFDFPLYPLEVQEIISLAGKSQFKFFRDLVSMTDFSRDPAGCVFSLGRGWLKVLEDIMKYTYRYGYLEKLTTNEELTKYRERLKDL